jgi:MFS transporter, OFA family, oxalate/formate antiporter
VREKYFYGYNIVAASIVIQGMFIGAMFAYGVFFNELQTAYGWSRATISGASSLAFLLMGAVGVLAGRLNDRIGPKIVVVVSGISFGLGYILMSRLQVPWQLYLFYGGLVGIGLCTHDVVTLSTIARWFVRRRGMMTGIVKVGTGAGQLLVPLIASVLIAAYGWRNACSILGAVVLVSVVAAAQFMRRDPQAMGLLPDGDSAIAGGVQTGTEEAGIRFRDAVRMIPFWIMSVTWFALFFCLMTIIVHIVPHARDLGLAPTTAAGVLSMIGGVSMAGRFVMGAAVDRIGGKRSMIICFIILVCGLILLQLASKAWMLFIVAGIYGFAHGGLFTVVSPTMAELFGTGSHGLLYGFVLFSGSLGGSFGPLLAGRIFDVTGSYRSVFIILTGLAVTGLILVTMLRSPRPSGQFDKDIPAAAESG